MLIHLLRLKNIPIFEQLELEEALLRADERNFLILNEGTTPACVLGISSQIDRMLHLEEAKKANLPLIRRFSGGGTVIVDQNTCFSTFILQGHYNPSTLHAFASSFFTEVFKGLPFSLHQNDYRLGEKKMGGNAQYFTKSRGLHHTSFLFEWDKERMALLKMPPKMPEYRQERAHEDFLIPLSRHFSSPAQVLDRMEEVCKEIFDPVLVTLGDVESVLQKDYRRAFEKRNCLKGSVEKTDINHVIKSGAVSSKTTV